MVVAEIRVPCWVLITRESYDLGAYFRAPCCGRLPYEIGILRSSQLLETCGARFGSLRISGKLKKIGRAQDPKP